MRTAGLVLLSVVLGLAACEGLLRLLAADRLPDSGLYEFDPDSGKRMRPGWSGEVFGIPVHISSQGLRNPETPLHKPPGRYRILVLGDSWTFGFRIQDADTFPRVLERLLAEHEKERGGLARVEVINAGVIGYSTEQEAGYLRVRGQRFEPDLVLLAYYPVNDTHRKMRKYRRYQRLRRIHPLLLDLYTFPRRLYLRQFVKGIRVALEQRRAEERVKHASTPGEAVLNDWTEPYREQSKGWQLARRAIEEIGSITREIHARGLVVLLPDALDLGWYLDYAHPIVEPLVRQAATSAGLGFLDLASTFAPYRGRELEIRRPELRHPDAAGYRLIAGAIAAEIAARIPSGPEGAE